METKAVGESAESDHREMERLIRGFQISQLIWLVAEMGLADRLAPDEKAPIHQLAEECCVIPQRLLRLSRGLAAFGIFKVTDGHMLGHTRLSLLLRTGPERNLALQARFWAGPGNWGAWGKLSVALTNARSPHDAAWSMSRFDYMNEHPDEAAVYNARMGGASGDRQDAIASAYDFSQSSVICDVGGGNGALLRAILRRYPACRGIVYDREYVVSAIKADELAEGRITVSSGDFFANVPSGADTYLLSWILHDWSDEESRVILANTRSAMGKGMKLLLAERLLDPDPTPGAAMEYLSDIQMMVLGGTERTQDEYQSLLAHSGFTMTGTIPTRSAVRLIEARAV
jgi:hypothetical protein